MTSEPDPEPAISRPNVLIVEDEWILALDLENILKDAGYDVCGPASQVSHALAIIETETIDLAVLDINLAGKTTTPVARKLRSKGTPFVFLSGHSRDHLDKDFRSELLISKPVTARVLLDRIAEALAAHTAP